MQPNNFKNVHSLSLIYILENGKNLPSYIENLFFCLTKEAYKNSFQFKTKLPQK